MHFDLALVDWNMPVMNGLEMLRQLRADGYSDLKVVMVTTEAENTISSEPWRPAPTNI